MAHTEKIIPPGQRHDAQQYPFKSEKELKLALKIIMLYAFFPSTNTQRIINHHMHVAVRESEAMDYNDMEQANPKIKTVFWCL